ncbi:class I SAM-dependent methyltransferase [Pseudanabaena sp. PCC 6802]|uniref:class I SAM-dependent methyltransferase n=1 Tax=Pseudanabaena sp. PCC 6802 TaxID=118173 RepID=UPI00034C2918|nr:class I SAM-dependent methyltransferase [Pseudanabaena sp. PCC 6802]
MQRIPEPEVMDSPAEAIAYDAMDFTEVNTAFAQSAIALGPNQGLVLDAGTGTARIPIAICQMQQTLGSRWQIIGIDLATSMLELGAQNIQQAGLSAQIQLERVDAKQMPYPDAYFDMVISNSIAHHLSDPLPFFRELQRVLKPNGGIFLRDLTRPDNPETLHALVNSIGAEYDPEQKRLFRDSLQAAFTVAEIEAIATAAGISGVKIYQSSDRHWTMERAYL